MQTKKVYLLGVDIGTTRIKVGIFTTKGLLKGFAAASLKVMHPRINWSEVSLTNEWEKFLECLSIAIKRAKISSDEIESIGLSTLCPALIALDEKGDALRSGIIYSDQRSITQSEWVYKNISMDKFFKITGNRVVPGTCSLTSILWIKENEPEIFRKTNIFGHANTFFIHKLTGKFAIDWTNASFTGLFDIEKRNWSEELCTLLKIPIEKLPPVLPSTTVIGGISMEASRLTNLKEGLPVVIGGADTACSALGVGIVEGGQVFESCGSSEVITVCCNHPQFDSRFLNRCHVIPDKWLSHGAMSSGGASLKWLKDKILLLEKDSTDEYQVMEREASISPSGANGVIFLPYLSGERTPRWDPYAKGVFWGLSLANDRGDIIRAVFEGVAYGIREIVEIIEKNIGSKIEKIYTVGGGAKSSLWNQIKANIIQRKILKCHFQETALLGAAVLGGIGTGVFKDYKEAIAGKASLLNIEKIYYPDDKIASIYNNSYRIYKSLYPALKQIYRKYGSKQ